MGVAIYCGDCILLSYVAFIILESRRKVSDVSKTTVVPTNSDSDVRFCLQLLSKTLTCTLHLS